MKYRFPILAALILAGAAFLHFSFLTWGAPSWDKHLRIFKDRDELARMIGPILEQRQKYYQSYAEMLKPQRSEDESRSIYKDMFLLEESVPAFAAIPESIVLERVRGSLIGVFLSDEQYPMKAISNLNPKKLDFNPKIYAAYGGFFYYTGGAFLALGKLLRLVSLTPGLEYYFTHPEETGRMYALLRAIGGCSVLLTLALLLWKFREALGDNEALLAGAFLAVTPMAVLLSHMVKAHLYGMFWLLFGFYFYWKTIDRPALKNYVLGAAGLGLSAASIMTNLPVGIAIFWVEMVRHEWNPLRVLKDKRFWLSCSLFFSLYLIFNYYIFLDLAGFKKTMWSLQEYTKGYDEYGKFNFAKWPGFFGTMFSEQVHWASAPFIAAGIAAAFARRNKFLLTSLLVMLSLTLMNLLTTRHPGVNARIFPFLAVFFAAGTFFLIHGRPKWLQAASIAGASSAILLSLFQSLFYLNLLREPSNLTRAADWVNSKVAEGSSIGVVSAQVSQSVFPQIHFLRYRLVNYPRAGQLPPPDDRNLPDYVIGTEHAQPLILPQYAPVQSWERPKKFLGIPFKSASVITGDVDVIILKKI